MIHRQGFYIHAQQTKHWSASTGRRHSCDVTIKDLHFLEQKHVCRSLRDTPGANHQNIFSRVLLKVAKAKL